MKIVRVLEKMVEMHRHKKKNFSFVVKKDAVKKTKYDKLLTKVDNIDTTGFVSKTKYDTDKSDLKKKTTDAEKRFLIQVHLLKKRLQF